MKFAVFSHLNCLFLEQKNAVFFKGKKKCNVNCRFSEFGNNLFLQASVCF